MTKGESVCWTSGAKVFDFSRRNIATHTHTHTHHGFFFHGFIDEQTALFRKKNCHDTRATRSRFARAILRFKVFNPRKKSALLDKTRTEKVNKNVTRYRGCWSGARSRNFKKPSRFIAANFGKFPVSLLMLRDFHAGQRESKKKKTVRGKKSN